MVEGLDGYAEYEKRLRSIRPVASRETGHNSYSVIIIISSTTQIKEADVHEKEYMD